MLRQKVGLVSNFSCFYSKYWKDDEYITDEDEPLFKKRIKKESDSTDAAEDSENNEPKTRGIKFHSMYGEKIYRIMKGNFC